MSENIFCESLQKLINHIDAHNIENNETIDITPNINEDIKNNVNILDNSFLNEIRSKVK